MILTAFNAISLIASNNNNNNNNNSNNDNDNNNNNVNINEGTNTGNIEDPNNMVNLPPASGGRKFRLKRMAITEKNNINTNYCKDQENIQKALSRMVLDVVYLMPALQKVCLNEPKISHRCIPQLHCALKTRAIAYNNEIFPDHSTEEDSTIIDSIYTKDTRDDNIVNKRVEKEKNEKKFKINERRIKLFLDVITIAAIQSCAENVSQEDKKKFAKVLMKKVYKGLSSKVRNQKGCKSAFRYRCGF